MVSEGLSKAARERYSELASRGIWRASELCGDGLIEELADHGLVREIHGSATLVPPLDVLPSRLDAIYGKIKSQYEALGRLRAELEYLGGRASLAPQGADEGACGEATNGIVTPIGIEYTLDRASWEVLDILGGSDIPKWLLSWPAHNGRSVSSSRILCDSSLLSSPEMFDRLSRRSAVGTEVRIGQGLGAAIRICDRKQVLFAPSRTSAVGVAIASPELAAGLIRAFDLLWSFSVPIGNGRSSMLFTPAQQRVVRLLSAGLSDDSIAQATMTSVRTVRAHVAAILRILGAGTRFSAGAEVARRGLIG